MATRIEMIKEIGVNLSQISTDRTKIISSKVTQVDLENKLNALYRDDLSQILMDKYPLDFEQVSYPFLTNVGDSIVEASTIGTSLVVTDAIFANGQEGFQVYNLSKEEFVTIQTFIDVTSVTLIAAPTTPWTAGDAIYILGNEWGFEGDLADVKEVINIYWKQLLTDANMYPLPLIRRSSGYSLPSQSQTGGQRGYYLTTIKKAGGIVKGFGILPFPTVYNGAIEVHYTGLPAKLVNNNDEPQLNTSGVSEALVLGVTAWAARILYGNDMSEPYLRDYNNAKATIIKSYRPRNRAQASHRRLSSTYRRMAGGSRGYYNGSNDYLM